jgi:PST family polysaccharide transporter
MTGSPVKPAVDGRPTDRRGVGRQALWNYLVFALSKSSTLIMTIVLARMLGPAEFGLFALAFLVMTLFEYVRDLGVAAALVQRDGEWAQIAPTGMTLAALSGLIIGAGAALGAPLAAVVFDEPALTPLVRVLAIGLAISAFGVLPLAALRRRLDYRSRLLPEVAGTVVKAVVAIVLAAFGTGIWSLVWAQLAASLVTTCGYWLVVRPPLRFGFDRATAAGLVRFGLPVTAVSFMAFAVLNVDYAAIGRRLGEVELGYYTLAYRLPELLVLNICTVVGDVLFSALSRLQRDRPAVVAKYLDTLRAVIAVTAPVGLGMAALSAEIVGLLYGPQFAPAADELTVLAAWAVLFSVNFHAGDAYKAIGRPGLLTAVGFGKLLVLAPAVWFAAGHSTVAVAGALLAVEALSTVVRLSLVRVVLGVTIRRHAKVLWGPIAAAGLMAVGVWAAGRVLPVDGPVLRLLVLVPLGVAGYGLMLRLLAPSLVAAAVRHLPARRAS